MSDVVVSVVESVTSVTVSEQDVAVAVTESPVTIVTGTSGVQGATGPTGATGAKGDTGDTGAQGPSGVIAVDGTYITNSGTSTSANLAFVPSALTIEQSQVTDLVTALAGKAALTASQTFTGTQTITNAATGSAALIVSAITGTTAAPAQYFVGGTLLSQLTTGGTWHTAGSFTAGSATGGVSARLAVVGGTSTQVGAIVRGAASQTANLQEWQDSAGTVLSRVDSGGNFRWSTYTASILGAASGNLTAITSNATVTPVVARGAASQTANLQEWQNSSSSTLAYVSSTGTIFTGGNLLVGTTTSLGRITSLISTSSVIGMVTRGFTSQVADLHQYQSSAGTVLGGRNGNSQIYTGLTTPVYLAVGGTIQSIATGVNPLITMASAHGLAVGDLVQIAGTTGGTYNGTNIYVGTVPSSTTFTIISGLTTGQAGAAGTVSAPAQASFTSRSAATVPLVANGFSGTTVPIARFQVNGSTLAQVTSAGNFVAPQYATSNAYAAFNEANSGGQFTITRQTAAAANPGANIARLYFRDGTTAGTLKLVVRAGAAGAETTILDNIPQ